MSDGRPPSEASTDEVVHSLGSDDVSDYRCEKILSTARACGRPAGYQVNGVLTCQRHLPQVLRRHARGNESGHLWASVQILTQAKRSSSTGDRDSS